MLALKESRLIKGFTVQNTVNSFRLFTFCNSHILLYITSVQHNVIHLEIMKWSKYLLGHGDQIKVDYLLKKNTICRFFRKIRLFVLLNDLGLEHLISELH